MTLSGYVCSNVLPRPPVSLSSASVSVSPQTLCTENVPEPLDFRSSDVTIDSFRVSWEHPASDVVLYRLIWSPTDGGAPEDVRVVLPLGHFRWIC